MDMPGLIIMIIIIILLSYIPYLQYLALIPLAVGCLVLSTEHSQSFLLYYGIVVGVFVLASVIEELLLNPKIMEKNIGINPVILILALSVWSYLFGIRGLIIGIPMTSLFILYFKRFVLTSYQEVFQDGKTDS
jgi:predicted PurR-regulated permease PerM